MKHLYKKPYIYFWLASVFILIIGYKTYLDIGGSALDINIHNTFNIHDTYFVVAHEQLIFVLSSLIFIPGFIYWVIEKLKLELNIKLTILHTNITVLCVFLYPLAELYFKNSSKNFSLYDSYDKEGRSCHCQSFPGVRL